MRGVARKSAGPGGSIPPLEVSHPPVIQECALWGGSFLPLFFCPSAVACEDARQVEHRDGTLLVFVAAKGDALPQRVAREGVVRLVVAHGRLLGRSRHA